MGHYQQQNKTLQRQDEITASHLSEELGLHSEKKVGGNWNMIKNGHSALSKHLTKPGNSNI